MYATKQRWINVVLKCNIYPNEFSSLSTIYYCVHCTFRYDEIRQNKSLKASMDFTSFNNCKNIRIFTDFYSVVSETDSRYVSTVKTCVKNKICFLSCSMFLMSIFFKVDLSLLDVFSKLNFTIKKMIKQKKKGASVTNLLKNN